jgi:16S rRNA (guanine(966)-N(2))-methyltransferase RsmD
MNNKHKYVRPFSEKLRKGIFSTIGKSIIDSNVLDLFAGSGMCSIDALYKGAKSACLVDNNYRTIRNLYLEVKKRNIGNNVTIYNGNVSKIISKLCVLKAYYNIVFIDPPYNIVLQRNFWKSLQTILSSTYIIIYRTNHPIKSFYFSKHIKLFKNIYYISNR